MQLVRWLLSPNDCCNNLIFGWIVGFLLAGGTGHSQPSQEIKVNGVRKADGEPLVVLIFSSPM